MGRISSRTHCLDRSGGVDSKGEVDVRLRHMSR